MPKATWYSQGSFCWCELATTDVPEAKSFYTEVFGLDTDESEIPGGVYVRFQRDGKDVAGLAEQQPHEREQGIPPHWNTYINVDDAEMTAKEAERLGATIIAPAFDVLESGRMAVVADPTGAPIGFWQAKDHIGAQVYAEDGTLGWFELMTRDQQRAVEFYTSLFGYGVEEFPSGSGPYMVLKHKGENAAGIMTAPDPSVPSSWTPYFQVADAEDTFRRATERGATPIAEITEAQGVGWFAWIHDPQGAVIAFIQPAPGQRDA